MGGRDAAKTCAPATAVGSAALLSHNVADCTTCAGGQTPGLFLVGEKR